MDDDTVVEDGEFCSLSPFLADEGLIHLLVANEVILKSVGVPGRALLDDCPVGLAYLVSLEHGIEPGERLAGLGEDDDAGGRPVEPVRDPAEDVAWFVVLALEKRLDAVGEGDVAGLVALYDIVAGLVDDDEVIVLVENIQRFVHR